MIIVILTHLLSKHKITKSNTCIVERIEFVISVSSDTRVRLKKVLVNLILSFCNLDLCTLNSIHNLLVSSGVIILNGSEFLMEFFKLSTFNHCINFF